MIRAVCPDAVSDLKTGFVTGWNIAPNIAYTITVVPGASSCAVWLFDAGTGAYLAGGAALVGTDQPVTLLPATSPGIGMVDADLGYHLLVTTDGTEDAQTYGIGPFVDGSDQLSAIYTVDNLAVVQATAVIREGTHYTDDASIMCPLGMDAWLGDVCSATVHGESMVGDIESVSFQAGPSSMADVVTLRRMSAILPDAPVVIVPPVVTDDAAETDAATATSGNVLTNDASGLTVVAVDGLESNVGIAVAGAAGGVFTIAANGAWTFDPDGDFATLSGSDTAETRVTYHASNGVAEAMATLTVTVSAVAPTGDPFWDNVSLCIIPYDAVGVGSVWSTSPISSLVTKAGIVPIVEQSNVKCVEFNGNAANHLVLHDNSAWMNDGVTPWTFDVILYETSSNNYEVLFINTTTDSAGLYAYIQIQFISGRLGCTISGGNAAYATNYFSALSTNPIPLNQFVKVRVIFTGTQLKIFFNGQLEGQTTVGVFNGNGVPNLGVTYIGRCATSSYPFSMKMQALRITKGIARDGFEDFAIESEAQKNPSRPYLDLCLVPFGPNGLNKFIDISPIPKAMTATGTGVVTATVDGQRCISFPGGQGVSANNAMSYLHDGVTSWTMDAVVRISAYPGVIHEIAGNFTNNTVNSAWGYIQLYIGSDGKPGFCYAGSSGSMLAISPTPFPLEEFTSIRVTFNGNVLKMFVNRVEVASTTKGAFTASVYQVGNLTIGKYPAASYSLTGHIAGFNIYKNIAADGTAVLNLPFEIA